MLTLFSISRYNDIIRYFYEDTAVGDIGFAEV